MAIQHSRSAVVACGRRALSNALDVLQAGQDIFQRRVTIVPQVRFYAQMRSITGCTHLDIDQANPSTLRELLRRLTRLFPGIQYSFFDEQENLHPDIPIFVNGRNPRLTGAGLELSLEPDDVVTIFSPIASGRMNVEGMRKSATNVQE